ncbi:pentatricopeptide repeat-containing protein At3g42630 [Ananas comosus]|uniref:Pentatricopeptide repeat-containing protein At3g42630 n=1 Tax=Ananas comosus TaxID=4615 RepID=A0A6P5GXE9_ANACO|nr:pentatricopeptide repeat-containing protein At3g42630 [Ananas comosus]XP_020110475.1 pentatricopeptide repeat-containing protein At3g42630 [Ananas comosus]XP_020110476.1 pentatricopeptide repeat-containing protein At3g42630 [Ananas comosus]XP_020110477.1 pentatricopeptide repeat-containing protein At3g42630 [Ananas comosus]XP_020110478.1 pentatricopeptide repeat-containing protein At3g42630 [Ananas comosus]XP_020110479.1 pentatricopeptide repeat-containing protein At3g42630 [Ananas comosus]
METLMLTLNLTAPSISPLFSLPRASTSLRSRASLLRRSSARETAAMNSLRRDKRITNEELAALIQELGPNNMPEDAPRLLIQLQCRGLEQPNNPALSVLMLVYAKNGFLRQAQALWGQLINSPYVPTLEVISNLMDSYATMGQFDEIRRIVEETAFRDFGFCREVYSLAVSCFGKSGQLEMMEDTVKDMVSKGFKVDSLTGNAFVKYYSVFGSLAEMEAAYQRLKKSRILIEEEAIRSMASAYISEGKFYKLGEFLKDVGLGRRNVGNLLWNLLLLSFAVNFKMKSLQREFLNMLDAGFSPNLTTFNIRTLAFSRMCMFWDLHLSIEHMKSERIVPDLVTFGCFVDAYMGRRLGRNLYFALEKMNAKSAPVVSTDPIVFEAFGKGDFHASSEDLIQSTPRQGKWTYSKLVDVYLKKQYRSNQIFWNY